MAVEFVIAAPLLVLLMLLVSAGGDWLSLTGEVSAAARDAARAASLARQFGDAQNFAQSAAQGDLNGICIGGGPTTSVQLLGSTDFADATDVQVTVTCTANLAAFKDVGFSTDQNFTDTATVPLDPFVERDG
jgi:Flp pilus assembly protein TadG